MRIEPIGAFLPVYPVYQPLPVRKKRKVEKPAKKRFISTDVDGGN
jgi:hypothetical protein